MGPTLLLGAVTAVVAFGCSARLAGSPDSLNYLIGARSLIQGHGLRNPGGHPYTFYGPVYPVLIALVSELGLSVLESARLVSVTGLSIAAMLAGRWTRRLTGTTASLAAGGVTAILIWPALLARFVWSENVFIPIALGAGLVAAIGIEKRKLAMVGAAGVLLGLGALTRYSGVVLFLAAVPVALLWTGSWVRRALAGLALLIPACVVLAPWVVHNVRADPSEPLGPRPPAPVPARSVLADAVRAVSHWVSPPGLPSAIRIAMLIVVLVVVAILAWGLKPKVSRTWWLGLAVPVSFGLLYLFGSIYAGIVSKVDPFSANRLLTPSYPFLAIGAVAIVWESLRGTRLSRFEFGPVGRDHVALVVLLLLLAAVSVIAVWRYGTALRPRELLATTPITVAARGAAAADSSRALLSNESFRIAWAADRPVEPLDAKPFAAIEWAAQETKGGRSVLLVMTTTGVGGPAVPPAVSHACHVTLIRTYADGVLYRLQDCSTST